MMLIPEKPNRKTDNYNKPNLCSNGVMLNTSKQKAQRNALCPEQCLFAFST